MLSLSKATLNKASLSLSFMVKHRQVTCTRTDDNSTRSQRVPFGPLIDQGRRPLGQSYLGGCPLA